MEIQHCSTTVIVPCFNERDSLKEIFTRLEAVAKLHPGWEALFIDDGSSDGSAELLANLIADSRWARLSTHARNRGLGAALRSGFREARGDIICTIDADCTYPPERIEELVAAVESGADIATASPWHPEAAGAAEPSLRFFVSRCASLIDSLVLGRRIYTWTSLFRAYRAPLLAEITPRANGFGAVAETLVKAVLAGYTIQEVPMPVKTRQHGASKMRLLSAVIEHLALLARAAGWRLRQGIGTSRRNGRVL